MRSHARLDRPRLQFAAAALIAGSLAPAAALAQPLRDLASGCGIGIGAAVTYSALNEPAYATTLGAELSVVTPENEMKWSNIHPQRTQFSFDRADAIVALAEANGMAVHGHTLLWHQQNPGWLTNGGFGRDEMIQILADHIDTVAGHYSGRVAVWDVVNEVFESDGSLRRSIWLDRVGPDYIELAFQLASNADPNARLVINDYSNETINAKSNGMYAFISDLLARGVPVHGIGFQLHVTTSGINVQSFADNMRRFAALGLDIYITELDVRMQLPPTAASLAAQANVYRSIAGACLDQPACGGIWMWGFTDAHSWIPSFMPGWGAALPFDERYAPKPAYDALSARFAECSAR